MFAGIMPRSLNLLFERVKEIEHDRQTEVSVRASVVRLSGMDNLDDMLRSSVVRSSNQCHNLPLS